MNAKVCIRSHHRGIRLFLIAFIVSLTMASNPNHSQALIAELPYRLSPALTSSVGLNQDGLTADGSLIAWQDSRSGIPDIYVYDMDDDREFLVSRSSAHRTDPAVSGTQIFWVNGANPRARMIQGVDLSHGAPIIVTTDEAEVADPAASNDVIVWRERTNGTWNIHGKNLRTNQFIQLTDDKLNQAYPAVSGPNVVWQEFRDGSWDVVVHNLETGISERLTETVDDDTNPRIDDTHVIFVRQAPHGGSPALILLDLRTRSERTIVSDHMFMRPAIGDGVIAWEDWRTGLPDIYAYDIASDQPFAVARSQQAYHPAVSARGVSWISQTDLSRGRVQGIAFIERLPTDPRESPAVPSPDHIYVPETKHFMSAGFKSYWQAHGGPRLFGYPLTEEFSEIDEATGEEITVQYFERVKLEFRPSEPEGEMIRLVRLAVELAQDRTFEQIEPFESSDERYYFPETGHSLAYGFRDFWEDNGGLGIFGFPISEEFVENGRTVQYFERARFELAPDQDGDGHTIMLGLIGQEALQRKGWLPAPPIDTTMIYE